MFGNCVWSRGRIATRTALLIVAGLSMGFDTHVKAQEVDESVDLTKFKTFAMRDGQVTSELPALNNPRAQRRLQKEIETALVAKGLVSTDVEPELIVTFQFGAERMTETRSTPTGRNGRGLRVVHIPRSEGMLTVELFEVATNHLVFRGRASDDEKNPQQLAEQFDKLAEKAVKKFPKK